MRILLLALFSLLSFLPSEGQRIASSNSRYRENAKGLFPVPTTQATTVFLTVTDVTFVTFSWTDGNGSSRIVLVKANTPVDTYPVNGTSYTANSTFAAGSQIGTGNFVTGIGSGPLTVTGLTPATTYYFAVFEFNGSGSQCHYLQTNPATAHSPTLQAVQVYGPSTGILAGGDSYTAGTGASPISNSWINLLATDFSVTATNVAIGGRGTERMCQILNQDATLPNNSTKMLALLIGLNDQGRNGGPIKTRNKVWMGHRSIIFNQFKKSTVAAGSASVTRTGTWTAYAANVAAGKYTNAANGAVSTVTNGATASYTFSGETNVVLQAIAVDGVGATYGTINIKIDGVTQSIPSSDETTQLFCNLNGWYDGVADPDLTNIIGPIMFVFTGLSTGSHTILVTTTNTSTVPLDFFGHLNAPASCAPALIGLQTYLPALGYSTYAGNLGSTAGADAVNAKLISEVFYWANLGYPIAYIDSNPLTNITTDMDPDHVHRNNAGHLHIKQSFKALITAKFPSYFRHDEPPARHWDPYPFGIVLILLIMLYFTTKKARFMKTAIILFLALLPFLSYAQKSDKQRAGLTIGTTITQILPDTIRQKLDDLDLQMISDYKQEAQMIDNRKAWLQESINNVVRLATKNKPKNYNVIGLLDNHLLLVRQKPDTSKVAKPK